MAVEVLASPVITHRGARVCVAGGDLHVTQINPRVEHGCDEGMAEHVRMRRGCPDARSFGEAPQAAGGGVAVWRSIRTLRPLSRIGPPVSSRCQPQLISERDGTVGRDGRQLGEVHYAQTLRLHPAAAKRTERATRGMRVQLYIEHLHGDVAGATIGR